MLELGSLRPPHGPLEDSSKVPFRLSRPYFFVLYACYIMFDVSLVSNLFYSFLDLPKSSFHQLESLLVLRN